MRAISDLMASLSGLTDGAVRGIRKTSEDPTRVSVLDVISVVTGLDSSNSASYFNRLGEQFPEVSAACTLFKFPGRGQRDTEVARSSSLWGGPSLYQKGARCEQSLISWRALASSLMDRCAVFVRPQRTPRA